MEKSWNTDTLIFFIWSIKCTLQLFFTVFRPRMTAHLTTGNVTFKCSDIDKPQDGAVQHRKMGAMTYFAAQSLETNFFFNPRAQMHWFRVRRMQCSLLTIFFFWQRKAWHSRVSLNWLWETYAKTLSWVLSAVQYEILKRKMQEYIFLPL